MGKVATAYVAVVPSTKEFYSTLKKDLKSELAKASDETGKTLGEQGGTKAGKSWGDRFKTFAKAGIVAAGAAMATLGAAAVKVAKESIEAGGALEQSIGGIEALYGAGSEAANKLIQDADRAWETAGMSANDYMQTVTSFSAALLNSVGGDSMKAAELADQAIRDMGDNVNRFGSDMESVQNAIMGLSRGNYTMLDNLKLGFAGNQQGMIDLINTSGILEKKIDSLEGVDFATMLEAIHAVQEQLNVTGTTANEAATTLEGSASAMKAAWNNALAAMSTGHNLGQAFEDLGTSVSTWLQNLGPMIGNVLTSLPDLGQGLVKSFTAGINVEELANGLIEKIGELPDLISHFADWLREKVNGGGAGKFAQIAMDIIMALGQALLQSVPALISIIQTLLMMVMSSIGGIISSVAGSFADFGGAIIDKIKEGFEAKFGGVAEDGRRFITWLKTGLGERIATLMEDGAKIINAIKTAIINRIRDLQMIGGRIITHIKSSLGAAVVQLVSVGMDIVRGIWSGISNGLGWIKSMLSGWIGNVVAFLKRVFKIGSPSKLMEEEIGRWLPPGIAVGMEMNVKPIDDASQDIKDRIVSDLTDINPEVASTLELQTRAGEESRTTIGTLNIAIYGGNNSPREIAEEVSRIIAGDVRSVEAVYA